MAENKLGSWGEITPITGGITLLKFDLRKFQQTPKGTWAPGCTWNIPLYGLGNPSFFFDLCGGISGVCPRGLLEFS